MKNFRILILLLVFLGFVSVGFAQQVVTTTTTTIVTIPGKTYVTTLTGGESTMIMVVPEYTVIMVEKRPDKICTIVVKPLKGGVVAIPGTTITIPGTTFQATITEQTIKYATTIREDGITTSTEYTYVEFVTTMYGQTFSMPLPIHAEIMRRCETIHVEEEVVIIMGRVPATLYYAAPGMTYTIIGTTYTIMDTVEVPVTEYTTVKIVSGTTYTERTVFPGKTETTVIILPRTVTTITELGRIVTSTVTYTTTVKTPVEHTLTTPTTAVTTSPTPPPGTEITKTVEGLGLPLDIIITITIITIIIVAAIVILLLRRK